MANLGELFKDDYNFEALAVPSTLAVLPIIGTAALLGFNVSIMTGAIIVGVEVLLYPLWLMANIVRNMGRALESKRYATGVRTTAYARLADKKADYMVRTHRARLEEVSGVKLLSRQQEARNPSDADARIIDAVNTAKEHMRSTEFKILKRELKSYGFWRNMLAIRPIGLTLTITAELVVLFIGLLSQPNWLLVAAGALNALFALMWCLLITGRNLDDAADRYCEQFYKSLSLIK